VDDIWRGGARPMEFCTEDAAEAWIADTIAPFCAALPKRQAQLKNGYRLDIGFRLQGMDEIPLAIEVKRFDAKNLKPIPEAIPQAWSYARELRSTCFLGPFTARNASAFDWRGSPLGTAAAVACHWSVGFIYFTNRTDGTMGGLMLGQNNVAVFYRDEEQRPLIRWHSDARRLLRFKTFDGSCGTRDAPPAARKDAA
jgi:hypothetical protein